MTTLTIYTRGIKVTTMIPPDSLPSDLVPPEPQPAGAPAIDLALEGSPLAVRAVLNGKSVRRALKQIAEYGPDGVNVLLQGNLKPPGTPGGPHVLDCAGLTVTPKVPKPAADAPAAPVAAPGLQERQAARGRAAGAGPVDSTSDRPPAAPLGRRMATTRAEAGRRPIRAAGPAGGTA